MEKIFEFTCPKCGKHRLACIKKKAIISCEVKDIIQDGDFYYSSDVTIKESYVSHFECKDCKYILKGKIGWDLRSESEVVDWIKKQSQLSEI